MPHKTGPRPPEVCLLALRAASWIVPACARSEWHAHWQSELRNWWVLRVRGEVLDGTLRFCRSALASAWLLRLEHLRIGHCLRHPWSVLAGAVAAIVLLAVLSDGFSVTRWLVSEASRDTAQMVMEHGRPRMRYMHENKVFTYSAPIVFALGTAVILIAIGPHGVRRRGWRYWVFFCAKTGAVLTVMPLLWIEGGAALRAVLPGQGPKILVGGLLLAWVFIALFACALKWSVVDQRQRCPVCLQRLSLPVTFGSWSSVFEPAKTELLCENGHGALAVSETASGEPDRWINLDASWRGL